MRAYFFFFRCDFNFSTPVELRRHGIYENEQQRWNGKRVTVFSSAQLGMYPYFSEDGSQMYNGGLPQVANKLRFRLLENYFHLQG